MIREMRRRAVLLRVTVWSVALAGFILYGPARTAMGPGAVALMAFHTIAGAIGGIAILVACLLRLRTRGALLTLAVALCLGTGVVQIARAAGGESMRGAGWVLGLHIAAGVAACLLGRRFLLSGVPKSVRRRASPALFFPLLLGIATAAYRYDPESYYRALTATNRAQSGDPHFPAGVLLADGRSWRPRPPAYCGTAGCHPLILQEWQSSAHALASADPFYRAPRDAYAARSGMEAARWCDGCHAPRAAVGEKSSDVPAVDCVTCHATTRLRDLAGNGRFVLTPPAEYPFAQHRDPRLRWLHGFLLRLRPGPHGAAFMKPELHRSSEFCASCHRMSYSVAQNGYKFLPGADEYGPWQESAFSGQSVAAHMPATETRQCAGCHMPPAGHGPSHSFVGGNTALPALTRDATQRHATDRFLRSRSVSVDLFALRRPLPVRPPAEEFQAPLEDARVTLRPGEEVVVDVVVRNRGVGHNFPGGTGDIAQVWLEVALADEAGRRLLEAGAVQPDGAPDSETHGYGRIALDRQGRRIERNNLTEMVTTVPPFSPRVIPAGQSDLARYRFRVPRRAGRVRLTARLLHRPTRPDYAVWALGKPSRVPITSLAEDSVAFAVAWLPPASTGEPPPEQRPMAQAMRFYDYGTALLAQDDMTRATRAMQAVAELLPGRPEGPIGLGLVYLQEGDLIGARAQLDLALRLQPDETRARFLLGKTHRRMGQYERALTILEPIVRRFPRDRTLLFELGQCAFSLGRYEEASEMFERMLDVDPNDLSAHYNLMRCQRQLRRFAAARREETIYRYLREDESVRRMQDDFLRAHPEIAREAQSVHEHVLRPVGRDVGTADGRR
jgi:Flp pilus assembly protein TadD